MSKNPKVKIELEKAGCETISIECSQKVKLTVLQTLIELRYGLPPLNIKPIDKKGLGILLGAFALIFVVNAFAFSFYGLIATLGIIVLNLVITQNYYVNYIQKKLKEGYEVVGDDSKKIVEEAGVTPIPSDEKLKKKKIFYYIFSAVIALFFILSFILGVQNDIEESARPIVTTIIQEQLFATDIECEKVTIDETVSDGFYKATAILNNGAEIKITIKEMPNGQIQVVIPYNQ
ncbi:hypothetical protein [Treponema pedis]|uniref:Uncharacterized protein n=2 Tax=Treponema pedis TaxID=409322 RepID=A0A7S6WRM4_9SPIR|nr:hypothetical protein [Treponema pedis]QOW62050.1 hypothetical protein IFE08_06890 [Treponema pedis]